MHKVTALAIKDIHPKWLHILNSPTKSGETLVDILDRTIESIVKLGGTLCPDSPDKILRCLQLDPDLIKVVIIGQDPYPEPNVSTGLAFACESKFRPSLEILLRELRNDLDDQTIGVETDFDGSLLHWEQQGVLLLNSSLSCNAFKPGSHTKLWEDFIVSLLSVLNDFKITRPEMTSIVFVFLGKQAQLFEVEINEKLHYKIMRYHPAAETYGSNKFTGFYNEVNSKLEESGQETINWIYAPE